MTVIRKKQPGLSGVSFSPLVLSTIFFVIALALFAVFILSHPIDWQQPETMRLSYFKLQDGIGEGPLTSSLVVNDLLKPLSTKSYAGSYQARYFSVLLEVIMAKINQALFPITGPFLGELLNLFLILLTAFLIVLVVKEWFGSIPAALVSAGFWLLMTQTLLDARYPIRPNMGLAAALSVYVFWELLRLRRRRPDQSGSSIARVTVALFFAFTSQEQSLCLIPAIAVLGLCERKTMAVHFRKIAAGVLIAASGYIIFFFLIHPFFMRTIIGEDPLFLQLQDGSPLKLLDPGVFFQRFNEFTVYGLSYLAELNLGWSQMVNTGERFLGGGVALGLAIFLIIKAGRRSLRPLAVFLGFYLPVTLVMFAFEPSSVEMPVYYYALIMVVFTFIMGGLLSGLNRRFGWLIVCGGLLIVGIINYRASAAVMDQMPRDFGFSDQMRQYTGDILALEKIIESRSISSPAYLSYPRPRYFDISTMWDIMLRVWSGNAERIFSMMVPVLHLRGFESGEILGNPREFTVFRDTPRERYENRAGALIDLPRRGWYELVPIKKSALNPVEILSWQSLSGERLSGEIDNTILGSVYRSVLPPGKWTAHLKFSGGNGSFPAILIITMADLQPAGSDDIYYRKQPLPEGRCGLSLLIGGKEIQRVHSYGWSYQLQIVPVEEEKKPVEVMLAIETDGIAEIIGPVLVESGALEFKTWTSADN